MIYLIKFNGRDLETSLNNLPKNYLDSLKDKIIFEESIIARYILFKEKNILVKLDSLGRPIFDQNIFFSISHKKGIVFVGTHKFPIGVDIEIIKKRGYEVFLLHTKEEYNLLGGKNLENFYYLWTIKESVIKLNLSGIDYLESIKINTVNKGIYNIKGVNFEIEITGSFCGKNFISYSKKEENLIYSISFENNKN